ncbi:MAG: S24/S26 family peptidase [Clostridia bacterium]|nr:S24/S26 family peptidase [Clostridia bacterium]
MNNEVKDITLIEMLPLIEEKINLGGNVVFKPQGVSMLPLIRPGKDSVVLSKGTLPLKKYDLPLYRRRDGSFVIHRVVGFGKRNSYIMCGDNQYKKEYGIKDEDIIGLVTGIYKGKRLIKVSSLLYKFYISLIVLARPFKHFLRRAIKWGLRKCKTRK